MTEDVVWGAILQLAMIRLHLTEALRIGEVFTKDGERAAVRSVAWTVLGVENQLRSILPMQAPIIDPQEPATKPEPGVAGAPRTEDFPSGSSYTSPMPRPGDIRFP